MQVTITKGCERDVIAVHRRDGSSATTRFPKKGPFPHDAVHLVVEAALNFTNGFWGRVANGMDPADVAALAKTGGHRSASRAEKVDTDIVELLQAERLVECFEAQLWSGVGDDSTLRDVLSAACAQTKVDTPVVSDLCLQNIRHELKDLVRQWHALTLGESLALLWKRDPTGIS